MADVLGKLAHDVFRRPSIGPVTAWLLCGLLALVGWLTVHYSPGAAAGGECRNDAVSSAGGVISPEAARGTLLVVMLLLLAASAQSVIVKRLTADWSGPLRDWIARQGAPLRAVASALRATATIVFHLPSWTLSLLDYVLARPVALIAGAGLPFPVVRYASLVAWMALAIAIAWLTPPPFGLVGFGLGSVIVLGIVRRWNWVERDREAFFVSRQQDQENERVGFAEDLRDEALVAVSFLLVLIPLGLRQLELWQPLTFCLVGASAADAHVFDWMTFFGAELAKSVPFVDWSEVFHVSNGSLIEPNSMLGAQVVFVMRASLDLFMLAALVQAIGIASRLAEQKAAFASGKIDILEPFAERTQLHALGRAIGRGDEIVGHPALKSVVRYNMQRLEQIVASAGDGRVQQAIGDAASTRAALALLMRDGAAAAARPFLIHMALRDPAAENRAFALRLAEAVDRTALLAVAFERASTSPKPGQPTDADAILRDFSGPAGALAMHAIRSARGEFHRMIEVAAGGYMMGSHDDDPLASHDERPRHLVHVPAFSLGVYQVTFEEFDAFCDATGYDRPDDQGWGRGNRPVMNVNWYDAKAYVDWLNQWRGSGHRLPSEAEWEYACRAGANGHWSFGDEESKLRDHAWFAENAEKKTHPVGTLAPNAFGLYDMHGNVWEWCEDPWHESYEGAPNDASVWTMDGNLLSQNLRGGCWDSAAKFTRSANRSRLHPSVRFFFHGLRVARTTTPAPSQG